RLPPVPGQPPAAPLARGAPHAPLRRPARRDEEGVRPAAAEVPVQLLGHEEGEDQRQDPGQHPALQHDPQGHRHRQA
ncbi:unnamed protein product, partial [Heterosigma akashiwo]